MVCPVKKEEEGCYSRQRNSIYQGTCVNVKNSGKLQNQQEGERVRKGPD